MRRANFISTQHKTFAICIAPSKRPWSHSHNAKTSHNMPPPSTPHVLLQRSGTSRHAAAVARGTAGTPSSKQRLDFDKAANAVDTPSESLSSSPPRSPRMVATSPAQIPPKVRRSDYDDQHGRYLAEQLQAEREKHQATQVKLDEERHEREKEEEARREAEARAAAAAHAAQTAAQAADAAEEATERRAPRARSCSRPSRSVCS